MKIEIELADLGLTDDPDDVRSGQTIRDRVIAQAADMLAAGYRKHAHEQIAKRIDAEVVEAISAIVLDALSKPIQRHTLWGEKVGEPTTVLEIARNKLDEFFSQPDRRDSYRRNEPATNLTGLVADVVRQAVTDELKPAITEARAAVAAAVRERLSAAVVNDLARS